VNLSGFADLADRVGGISQKRKLSHAFKSMTDDATANPQPLYSQVKLTSIVLKMENRLLKKCPKCGQFKKRTDFYRRPFKKSVGLTTYCKECVKKHTADYQKRDGFNEKMATYMRTEYQRLKLKAFKKVSKNGIIKCVTCGCSFLPILQINHKNGGGRKEKKRYTSQRDFYRHIVKGSRKVDDLEVLCRVCNAKHYVELKYALKYTVSFLGQSDEKRLDESH